MPSSKLITLLLIVSASLNCAHAAQDPAAPTTQASLNSAPDEARIASDLETTSLWTLASTRSADSQADYTSIRSSLRTGDILEFRVTSIYDAAVEGQPQREVDSTVSYQMTGDRWTLREVKVTDTRETQPSGSGGATERC